MSKLIKMSLEHAEKRYTFQKNHNHFRNVTKKEVIALRSDSYCAGYLDCDKYYHEKLNFIKVEQELPPIDIPVILKFKDWKGNEMYQIYTLDSVERREHFLKTHLKFTEWRFFL